MRDRDEAGHKGESDRYDRGETEDGQILVDFKQHTCRRGTESGGEGGGE